MQQEGQRLLVDKVVINSSCYIECLHYVKETVNVQAIRDCIRQGWQHSSSAEATDLHMVTWFNA